MIQEYTDYLRKVKGYAENTAMAYGKDLREFSRYAKDIDPNIRWSTVTQGFIQAWQVWMYDQGLTASTIRRRISAIRMMYNYAMAQGMTNSNPARYITSPKKSKRLPRTIETSSISQAIRSERTEPNTRLLLAILYETGMRIQEVLDIQEADIDHERMTIRVHGKGNKERTVAYGSMTDALLKQQYTPTGERLFNIDQREARYRVYNAIRPYTTAEKISPHIIRHTTATRWLMGGMTLSNIAALLGHDSVKTTEIYATTANSAAIEEYRSSQAQA